MWVWFVGVAMGVAYVLGASLKKLAPMNDGEMITSGMFCFGFGLQHNTIYLESIGYAVAIETIQV